MTMSHFLWGDNIRQCAISWMTTYKKFIGVGHEIIQD